MERRPARGARRPSARARRAPPALPAAAPNGLTASLFELDDVTATRGGIEVLRGVRLGIGEGVTALLGPSGSGKSTLLRLLNRLADAERGVVRFRGEDVKGLDVRELRRRACLVPQLPAPLPGTVADNLRYGPALFGRAVGVERPLALAGLTMLYADRDASQLSVGEQQRVMLARALALEPEVLLLDEPTSALDDYTKGGVERTLAALAEESGLSMVLVTHERAQAERLAGRRIVRLENGRVVP